jgi:GDSL-like Lipase/Acylhydrolase family
MTQAVRAAPARARRNSWIASVLLMIVTLGVCLEGGSRILLSVDRLRGRIAGIDDSSYRLQWIQLRGGHLEWTGPFAEYQAGRGWILKPNIKDMRVSDGTVLNTNSMGIRGKIEYSYARKPGKQRIVLLGDSFTFGAEVADDQTFSRYLESNLENTEVLNLGVQGYGHDQMLLYLREEGVKYHPDVVILGFTFIDVYRNIEKFFAYAKPRFKLASGELKLTNVPVPSPEQVLAGERYRLKSLDMLEILYQKLRWAAGKNEADAESITRLILDEIIRTTRGIGAAPVLVYLPVNDEIQRGVPTIGGLPSIEYREEYLRRICQTDNVPCLFLGPRFRKDAANGVDFHPQKHWNPKGHAVGGEEIKEFLLKNNLLYASNASGTQRERHDDATAR